MYKILTFNLPNISNLIKTINNTLPCKGNGENIVLERFSGTSAQMGITVNLQTAVLGCFEAGGYANPVGISQDVTKSGIVVDLSSVSLSCNYAIKY